MSKIVAPPKLIVKDHDPTPVEIADFQVKATDRWINVLSKRIFIFLPSTFTNGFRVATFNIDSIVTA